MASKDSSGSSEGDKGSSSSSSMTVEGLKQYLFEKFNSLNLDDSDSDKNKEKVLENVSLDGVVDYIKMKENIRIITMAGAGISTSAGIPDFRSPGSGLYHNLQKYNLPDPQAIFELDFFSKNPKPFFELAKELYPGSFQPTPCHYFIKLLEKKGLLMRHYTQNIDTLERVAGISEDKLVEAHGTFYTGHCQKCRQIYDLQWMKERIFADEIPKCTKGKCSGVVKPDIVFFGENLPARFYNCVEKDFTKCNLLIIMGSSLVVQPFASLIDRVQNNCPRLLINREKIGERNGIWSLLGMSSGFDFDSKHNARDVAWLGDCDEGCQLFADKLGWGDELREMIKSETEHIDKKNGDQTAKIKSGRRSSKENKSKPVENTSSTPETS